MAERPSRQRQPFRFWFPFRASTTRASTSQQPTVPIPQRTLSRIPTSASSQPPPQPRSPPQSSQSPPTTSQQQLPTARRASQPSPSPSPSQRSSRSQPADQRATPQPSPSRQSTKPAMPSRAASQLQPAAAMRSDSQSLQPTQTDSEAQPEAQELSQLLSPTLPSVPQSESPTKPSPQESQTPVEKIPPTILHPEAQPQISSQSQEQILAKPAPQSAEGENQPKEELETKPTSADSLQKDIPAEPIPTTATQHPKAEIQTEEIKEEKSKPNLEPKLDTGATSQLPKLDEKPEGIPEEKPKLDLEPKQDREPSQVPKLDEKSKEMPEEKPKLDLEPKQDREPSQVPKQDEKPKVKPEEKPKPKPEKEPDLEQKQDIETSQVPKLDEKPKEIPEEKPKPKPEKEQEMKPTETLKSDTISEEFKETKPKTKLERQEDKLQARVSEEPDKRMEPELSIMVSDSKPPRPHLSPSESISNYRVREPEQLEQANDNEKESSQIGSNETVSKIAISSITRGSSSQGERANFQKEIKEGLSKLVKKLSIGHSGQAGNKQAVSIITLAGQNKGATMLTGHDGITREGFKHTHRDYKLEKDTLGVTSDDERSKNAGNGNTAIAASVNSNVQTINNSILKESSCCKKNPGVHLILSTKPTEPMSFKGRMEPLRTQKTVSNITPIQKLTYEPNIRRRSLRGLFVEPSEDDIEDLQKPRRHGCRFSCDEKKKGKADEDK